MACQFNGNWWQSSSSESWLGQTTSSDVCIWHENVCWSHDVGDGNDDVADHRRMKVETDVRWRLLNSNDGPRPDNDHCRYTACSAWSLGSPLTCQNHTDFFCIFSSVRIVRTGTNDDGKMTITMTQRPSTSISNDETAFYSLNEEKHYNVKFFSRSYGLNRSSESPISLSKWISDNR
jgi:hypothetical protein